MTSPCSRSIRQGLTQHWTVSDGNDVSAGKFASAWTYEPGWIGDGFGDEGPNRCSSSSLDGSSILGPSRQIASS